MIEWLTEWRMKFNQSIVVGYNFRYSSPFPSLNFIYFIHFTHLIRKRNDWKEWSEEGELNWMVKWDDYSQQLPKIKIKLIQKWS